ncbi:MAG: hypothetical protein KJ077_30325 [Anaerolineae bacterium]|nr:hypothetical protein [Anaerolineae bacterium]
MSNKKFTVLFFGLLGGLFLLIGLGLLVISTRLSEATRQAAALPLLNAVQLSQTPAGAVAVIEGKIAERNPLHAEGFVVYRRQLYRGERCSSQGGTATPNCEAVWTEEERVTPPVWLDLVDGRIRLANADYALYRPPSVWQSTEGLIKDRTVRYEGFKINSPVFAQGIVVVGEAASTFKADFLYGGSRDAYFSDQRSASNVFFWLGAAFTAIGGGVLVVLVVNLLARRKR